MATNTITMRADMDTVRAAYRRLAGIYDYSFGPALRHARATAVARVNALPGNKVLEVGVGTGLALPFYSAEKNITGIDVSEDMLRKARRLTAARQLGNVEALLEMDAQATIFASSQFDIAAAMFVASVVPDARALLTELRRVVKPGGTILVINHFARDHGPIGWLEKKFAAATGGIGWHADFRIEDMINGMERANAVIRPVRPLAFFQMIELKL